ncbi:MAG: phosphatidate cytidylyltransferase [Bacteroidales bacterium]|nr:phosphatidate cytidylyltransferase [Bacteroidales bacterium]MCF6342379.1 phosphatidate cytidylyltransferase [Bacteroidales bacterium]
MKEIYTRSLTGFFFIVAVIGSILLHPLAFFIVFSGFTYVALLEFLKLSGVGDGPEKNRAYFASGMLVYFLTALMGLGYLDLQFAYFLLLVFFFTFVFELFRKQNTSRKRVGAWFTGFVYIAIPFGLMNSLFVTGNVEGFRTDILIGLFVIIWTSDVFAYLVGSWLGKHKLFERISPKKSWEGSIGGLLFALLAGYILSLFFHHFSLANWLTLTVIIVVAGALGDLIESMFKRQAGEKDSGSLFPGHGGVLDRFDAVMFATPFVFVYVNLIST